MSGMKCPFLNECSAIDLERIKQHCFKDFGSCTDYVACNYVISMLESEKPQD